MKNQNISIPWILFCVFWLMAFHFLNLDGNWYDILPFARAKLETSWIPNDWYFSRDISYRNLFNLFAGSSYQFLGLLPTYVFGKLFVYGYFSLLIVFILRFFSIPNFALTVFMPIFCIYHSFTADEWMINEFDTKTIAYLFCLNAWLFLLQKKYTASALILGIACSFHLLVGGYFLLIVFSPTAFVMLLKKQLQLSWKKILLLANLFLAGSFNAFLFAISWLQTRADSNVATIATEISIWIRLSNHLMPSFWDWNWIIIKIILVLALLLIWLIFVKKHFEILLAVIAANLILFFFGAIAWQLELYSLVSLYPFRVPDVILPFITALLTCGILAYIMEKHFANFGKLIPLSFLSVSLVMGLYEFHFSFKRFEKRRNEIPFETFYWIKENTPKESSFLVNPNEKYFYAFAERSSLVTFKHFPQLAPDIIEWKKRIELIGCELKKDGPTKNRKRLEECYSSKTLFELDNVAKKMGAKYFLSEKIDPSFKPEFDSKETIKLYKVSQK
jgi:hypothetical protein